MLNLTMLNKLLHDKKYNGETIRVLMLLVGMVEYGNRIKAFTQKGLAEAVGMSQPQISRSMKKLTDDGIIYKDGLEYYFSKALVYSGGEN